MWNPPVLAERLRGRGGDGGDAVTVGRDQDAELVPAEAVGGTATLGHGGLQRAGQADQQGVAGGVAKGVVVGLEPVEVEQHQQQRAFQGRFLQPAVQVEPELAPVGDPGEGVAQRSGDQPAMLGQERHRRDPEQDQRHHHDGDRPSAHPEQGTDRHAGACDHVPVVGVALPVLQPLPGDPAGGVGQGAVQGGHRVAAC
jgi:hypothetical protein